MAQITSSRNGGLTWSSPRLIAPGAKHESPRAGVHREIIGEEGVSFVQTPSGGLLASWGDYREGRFWVARRGRDDREFGTPVLVGHSPQIKVPITQLVADEKGERLHLLAYQAHSFSDVVLFSSVDGGMSWKSRRVVSNRGAMPVAIRSGNVLHVIWSEQSSGRIDVKHQSFDERLNPIGQVASIAEGGCVPEPMPDDVYGYIGAYQGLTAHPDGTLHAFWINFRKSQRIFQSIWRP